MHEMCNNNSNNSNNDNYNNVHKLMEDSLALVTLQACSPRGLVSKPRIKATGLSRTVPMFTLRSCGSENFP